jgi:hypothetical protein
MSTDQFRQSAVLTGRMAQLLADPVLQQYIAAMREDNVPTDLGLATDAIVSVRLLNRMTGFENAIKSLLEAGTPPPPEAESDPEPLWGTKPDQPPTK